MSQHFLRKATGLLLLPTSLVMAQTASPAQPAQPPQSDTAAEASTPPATKSKEAVKSKDAAQPQEVVITGGRGSDMEQRRNASAAKLIFGREDLDRHGDNSLADVLKRLPGISAGGKPGRGGEVRMRGMGGGYTQILLNGERAPRGFSLDSLTPDQVERIEVIRGTVAEHSTQAIAGTINIILREGYQQRDIQLKFSDSYDNGQHSPNLSITAPGKYGNLTYTLNASLSERKNSDHGASNEYDLAVDGSEIFLHEHKNNAQSTTDTFNFSPRLAWRFENGDNLTLQSFVMRHKTTSDTSASITPISGNKTPKYGSATWRSNADFTMARVFGNWVKKLDAGGRLDSKFGVNSFYMESTTPRREYDLAGNLSRELFDQTSSRERGANFSTKFSKPFGEGHLISTGIELEYSKRIQTRLALVNQQADPFNDSGDDNLQASSRRLAAFVQDEWEINPQWSTNLGLRWESIKVASGAIDNRSNVLSPIAHLLWRIPGTTKDQIRMSASHSYRAPSLSNIIATPALSHENSPSSPDRYGNPNLKPEQALGLELAFEHYLADGGLFSANLFRRNITDLTRRITFEQSGPLGTRWVAMPSNIGNATTHGLELEAKFRLNQMIAAAPEIDVRANYSWMWSAVDGIPGPNNRLDKQAQYSANLGLDYRIPKTAWSIGGSLNWTPAVLIQSSDQQLTTTSIKRQFDAYALWKINSYTQLRLAASNLLPRDYNSSSQLQDRGILHVQDSFDPTTTAWNVRLEFKL